LNAFLLLLIFASTAVAQVLIGGMRPIFAIPAYLIIALAGLVSVFLLRKPRPMPSVLCMLSAVLFFSYILWRAYTSPVEYLSRHDRYMVLAALVVYFTFALYITDPKLRLYLVYGLFLLAVGHLAVGAIQFSQENNYLPFGYHRADYGKRASGFYVCPNHYAGLLEMLAVMAAAVGCWGRVGVKTRLVLLYFSLLLIAGVAISGSRGGYVSIAFAFMTLVALSILVVRAVRPQRTLLIGGIAVAITVVLGVAGVGLMKKNPLLSNRVGTIVDPSNMRLQLWDAALKQYHTQPATGTGAGTYLYLGRLYRDPRVVTDPVWVHNDYYHLLAEYGYLGAIGFALFLGCHLWQGGLGLRRIIQKRLVETHEISSNALALNVGALAAIAAMVAHSVVDFNAHIPGNTLVLAALFGMLANPPTLRSRELPPGRVPAFPFKLLIPACAIALAVDAAPHLRGEWFSEKARVALRDQNYLTALREAHSGLEVEKTNPDLHYYLGEARRLFGISLSTEAARNSMNEAAFVAFTDSLKLFPQDEKVWVKRAQALDLLGRHEEALADLDKAKALDPNLDALYTYYAAHYEIQGDQKKALEFYEKARSSKLALDSRESLLRQMKDDGAR
jgi:O-antigen ligase